MEYRECKCGCGKWLPITRADREYYSKDCRNRVSNANYRDRLRTEADRQQKILSQENVFASLWPPGGYRILIDQNFFDEWGIRPDHAQSIYQDEQGRLIRAVFGSYALVRTENQIFELLKLQ